MLSFVSFSFLGLYRFGCSNLFVFFLFLAAPKRFKIITVVVVVVVLNDNWCVAVVAIPTTAGFDSDTAAANDHRRLDIVEGNQFLVSFFNLNSITTRHRCIVQCICTLFQSIQCARGAIVLLARNVFQVDEQTKPQPTSSFGAPRSTQYVPNHFDGTRILFDFFIFFDSCRDHSNTDGS